MVRRRFEMHQYRQALLRMRQGDSDRQIAAARVMGRPKAAQLRELARQHGWLAPEQALPEDEAIAAALGEQRRPASTISSLEAHRTRIGSCGTRAAPPGWAATAAPSSGSTACRGA
jgi:hypothetical protein